MDIELHLVEMHRSIGRIEGKIDGIQSQNLPERVRILEQRQAWLKGAWAFLIGAFAWLFKEIYK
jgi:hypothetical protein